MSEREPVLWSHVGGLFDIATNQFNTNIEAVLYYLAAPIPMETLDGDPVVQGPGWRVVLFGLPDQHMPVPAQLLEEQMTEEDRSAIREEARLLANEYVHTHRVAMLKEAERRQLQ